MTITRDTLALVVGCALALLLQIILAPNIVFFSAMPNVVLVFVVVYAILRPDRGIIVPAFVMGLLYNLMCGGTVGFMSLMLILVGVAVSHAFSVMDNASLFMPLLLIMLASFVVEICTGFGVAALSSINGFETVLFRSIPCALYDSVVGFILYPIMARFMAARPSSGSLESPRLI